MSSGSRIIVTVGGAAIVVTGASVAAINAATVIVAVGAATLIGLSGYGLYRWLSNDRRNDAKPDHGSESPENGLVDEHEDP